MIVVILVGVLAAIAIPMYDEYYRKKDRAVAQQEMLRLASELEKYRAKNFKYEGFDPEYLYKDLSNAYAGGVISTPIDRESDAQKYGVEVVATNSEWKIVAIRKDTTKQARNYDMFLDSKGTRCMTRTENAVSTDSDDCGTDGEAW